MSKSVKLSHDDKLNLLHENIYNLIRLIVAPRFRITREYTNELYKYMAKHGFDSNKVILTPEMAKVVVDFVLMRKKIYDKRKGKMNYLNDEDDLLNEEVEEEDEEENNKTTILYPSNKASQFYTPKKKLYNYKNKYKDLEYSDDE